jgi:signal transduction histidine kinase/ligand-binding sensor domain-containing protein/DNA-binding NarL/FixJ family response regulator
MICKKIPLIYGLCSIWVLAGSAQPLTYIGIEKGLSNNTVTSIHKDTFGFMWFGTWDGLSRYDGYSFKIFRNKFGDSTSLPNDIVMSVNSDQAGNVWVGTQKGLGVLDNKTLRFSSVAYSDHGKRRVLDKYIYNIQRDRQGNMYIGSADLGLLVCPKGAPIAKCLLFKGLMTRPGVPYGVTAINADDEHNIYFIMQNAGLCLYQPLSGKVSKLSDTIPEAFCIKGDHSGNLWIGTRRGLYSYHRPSGQFKKADLKSEVLNNSSVTDILFDKQHHIWITTDGEGVILKDQVEDTAYRVLKPGGAGTISSDAVYTIFEDELGRKWIGTLRGGIDLWDEKKNQFKTYAHDPLKINSLVNNFTFSFCEDENGDVWIGTDGGGISLWKRKSNTFQNYVHTSASSGQLNNNRVSSIVKDNQQNIWIATYGGGICRFDRQSNTFRKIFSDHGSFWKLYIDHAGDIWASCLRGEKSSVTKGRLYKYDKALNRFLSVNFDVGVDVITIIDDDLNNLWLGGFNSLMHANKKRGIDKVIELKAAVRALYKSSDGRLWVGTYGRGLMLFNPQTRKFLSFTEENGLCNNKVLNIEEDEQKNIWVSTFGGLSKVNPKTYKIESFYSVDGLQSNQFYYNASVRLHTGELMFGGIKGFNIFNPANLRQVHDFPPLYINGLRIANTEVNAKSDFLPYAKSFYTLDHILLPYDKAILSLDFVSLEYSLPEKIQYKYLLQGRDAEWNNIGNQRSVNYSHLNEGNYVLKIKSTNASGIWNNRERLIYITVIPPWYRTWLAFSSCFLFFVALVYAYLYYHRKQTQLKYEVKFVEELNEKKIAFFTNISHELRTPLTLIVNPIKDLLHIGGANLDLIDISAVYRNSRRLLSLVDQLLLFKSSENELANLQSSVLNLKEICYEVYLCFNNQVKSKEILYEFICDDDRIMVYGDREKLEIILFNLISNAIKYTPEKGKVIVEVKSAATQHQILIRDSGRGIPSETGDKLFEKFYRLQHDADGIQESGFGIGLFLAHKYVELHQGKLTYTSVMGEGTIFTMSLPTVDPLLYDIHLDHYEKYTASPHPLVRELITDSDEGRNNALADRRQTPEGMEQIVNNRPVILLIDDDAEMRRYITRLLQGDYSIQEAANSAEGFESILEVEPDIIVCDVVMQGGLSGVEFCSKMKESSSFSHIPVILLTGSSSPEIKLKGIECGADDYITKPFERELLVARIKSMLKGRDTLKNYFYNEVTLKNNSLKIPADYSDFLSKCIVIIENHLQDDKFSLKIFTEELGISQSKLFRKIKSISGLSSAKFIRYIRLRKAAELMIQTDMQIKEIACRIGIQDTKYFREQFNKLFRMNPSDYIKKYRKTFTTKGNLNMKVSPHRESRAKKESDSGSI